MEANTLRLYSSGYKETRTYLLALVFIAGNIVLPQLFHLIPAGGTRFLPIYFFTLIGAYKYGRNVGLLTAVLSPLINYLLFEMPSSAVLPVVIFKSVLLALAAGIAASHFKRISIPVLTAVISVYQITGALFEWFFSGSLHIAGQNLIAGIPGMFLQIFGGYLIIKSIFKF